jgi:hypothetical protein
MNGLSRGKNLAAPFLLFSAAGMAFAVSPDLRLLQLVPPGAQIVAGMSAPTSHGQPGSLLLLTNNNLVDLKDFFALSGVDSSRNIHQVIFVAGSSSGNLAEHSLLISGHFDGDRLFNAAVENGASESEFKSIPILVLQPFERDRGNFKDVRWLAVLTSSVVVFGTISSVQQELDRHLGGSAADPSLVQRLIRLRRVDETWCLLAGSSRNDEIRLLLDSFDPMLAETAHDGDTFQFGIHYGRLVEFEYELTAPSSVPPSAVSNALTQVVNRPTLKGPALLSGAGLTGDKSTWHGMVRVSRARYDAWVGEVVARGRSPVKQ